MEVSDGRTIRKQEEERGNVEKVKTWLRKRHRKSLTITKQMCINEIGLSRTTVYKHWNTAISEVENEK